jgi:hypothetical protein
MEKETKVEGPKWIKDVPLEKRDKAVETWHKNKAKKERVEAQKAERKARSQGIAKKLADEGFSLTYMHCYGYEVALAWKDVNVGLLCYFAICSLEDEFSKEKARELLVERIEAKDNDHCFPCSRLTYAGDDCELDADSVYAFMIRNRFVEYVITNRAGLPHDMVTLMRYDLNLNRYRPWPHVLSGLEIAHMPGDLDHIMPATTSWTTP